MKVLVLSLLRVGDLIMHEKIVSSLRAANRDCEVHVLVNDVSSSWAQQSKAFDSVHVFPRAWVQTNLVEETRPLQRAKMALVAAVEALNNLQFDRIYNLSHTSFSARLMDLLWAKEKIGAHYEKGRVPAFNSSFDNPWYSFFNDHYSRSSTSSFHYLDLLAAGLGLPSPPLQGPQTREKAYRICFQVLTSDSKKDWPQKNFVELSSLLGHQFPGLKMTILGAPNEEKVIRDLFEDRVSMDYQFVNWGDLQELLHETKLLITGDTSVAHLAAALRVPTLSLFLGSANPQRTAPYLEGALILQSQVRCTPCDHRSACSQDSHLCGESLSVETVFSIATEALSGVQGQNPTALKGHLYQVRNNLNGKFILERKGKNMDVYNFQVLLDQMIWQIFLDRGYLEPAGTYGSSAQVFLNDVMAKYSGDELLAWTRARQERCEGFQLFVEELDDRVVRVAAQQMAISSVSPSRACEKMKEISDSLQTYLLRSTDSGDYCFQMKMALEEAKTNFVGIKAVRAAINETKILLGIEHKLVRTLLTELKERGHRYVSRSRTLSIVGSPSP